MNIFLNVFSYVWDSVTYGFLISVGCVVLIYYIVKGIYPKSAFSPIGKIAVALLLLLSTVQSIMLFGGIKLKSMLSDFEVAALDAIERAERSGDDMRVATDDVLEQYPMLDEFLDDRAVKMNAGDTVLTFFDNAYRAIDEFTTGRILWLVLFYIVGTVVIVATRRQSQKDAVRPMSGDRSGVSYNNRPSSRPTAVRSGRYRNMRR